jgi:hypothetical protein
LTKITKINADWTDVKNECRNTVNKEATEKEPTIDFKKKILISEHSPIRLIEIKWRWEGIKSWISVHFARHWLGWDKWISTQRNDRTGVDRDKSPQDTPVNYDGKGNAQALINVARFRLCNSAHPETRTYMEDLKESIHEFEPELSDVMQRNCIYRGGCPEFNPCPYWKNFCEKHKGENLLDIQTRYDLANKDFYESRKKRSEKNG